MEKPTQRERLRGKLLEMMPKGAACAEIGVWEGGFSARILEVCAPKELHLIDPWLYQPEFADTGFGRKKNEHLMDEKYASVVEKFRADTRVKVHRGMSADVLEGFADGSLDWVYIDGNHNEPFVGQDLALCLAKVKANGIIAGDDFNWNAEKLGAPVKRAVEALVAGLGSKAELTVMGNQYIIQLKRG